MLTIEKINAGKKHEFENKLSAETSPYLLQHAHNPVNWYPWGEEAFEKARKENKPILLSIGYSTCHWCHVMEHESFEDKEIANMMNQHYVAIKVDREQRPDIDSVYMSVVQGMTGRGGWPMTVWLTPEKTPYYGGTYFPARDGDRGGHPGFLQLLERLADLYQKHPQEITERANQIAQQIQNHMAQDQSGKLATAKVFERGAAEFERSFDSRYGGFGFAPKFPRPCSLQFLMHEGARAKSDKATGMAIDTLKAMLYGGIFDQLGGGFHRYSVDAYWLVSHFEKMLYDQSQITLSMMDAWQITGDDEFKRGTIETLDYIRREMTDPKGGFYSATDADSEGVEGKFFVWDLAEITAALDKETADLFIAYYGVTPHGNFEERNILFIQEKLADFAKRKNLNVEDVESKIKKAKEVLYALRAERVPPLTDDKVITAWNGLMIASFARASFLFEKSEYLESATRAADFILQTLIQNNELYRSTRADKVNTKAFLDDYACLIYGLLELFEVTGQTQWFTKAKTLQDQMIQKFWDVGQGGFYASSENSFFVREKPFYDGAEPSGNSIAAINLLRFASFLQDESYRAHAKKIFEVFAQTIETNPTYLPQMLVALDYYHAKPKEIVTVHDDSLIDVLRKTYIPNKVWIRGGKDASLATVLPAIKDKLEAEKATAYVCQDFVCQAPARDAETFHQMLLRSVDRN